MQLLTYLAYLIRYKQRYRTNGNYTVHVMLNVCSSSFKRSFKVKIRSNEKLWYEVCKDNACVLCGTSD